MAKKRQPEPVEELEDDPGRDPDEVFAHEDDVITAPEDDDIAPDELEDESDLEEEPKPPPKPRVRTQRKAFPAEPAPVAEPVASCLDEPVPDTTGERVLTAEDKSDCLLVVVNSHDYLRREKGWTTAEVIEFLDRPEVRREVRSLEDAFKSRTTIQERQQFFSQSKINNLVPAALQLLQRTLLGDREVDGKVLRAPSRQQYDAAMEVLKRSNIQGSKFTLANGSSVLDNVDSAAGGALAKIRAMKPEDRDGVRRILANATRRMVALQQASKTQKAAIVTPDVDEAVDE